MNHDPRLDAGRAALIATLDQVTSERDAARAKVSELAVKLADARAELAQARGETP
jgi:hypothetical protein